MQFALLQAALAAWPRRHAPLLEVNCGSGIYLQFLWECGFDVQAVEADASLRQHAQRRAVPGLEVFAGSDEDLPFENDSFDWVIIHLQGRESLAASIREGARLARRGMMVTFWNSMSLPALLWNWSRRKEWMRNALAWQQVWSVMRSMRMGRVDTLSTLVAPMCAWKREWTVISRTALPLGAWCILRLDLEPAAPLTGLPLRLEKALGAREPALERMNRQLQRANKGCCKSAK